jgi:hypothetical protein
MLQQSQVQFSLMNNFWKTQPIQVNDPMLKSSIKLPYVKPVKVVQPGGYGQKKYCYEVNSKGKPYTSVEKVCYDRPLTKFGQLTGDKLEYSKSPFKHHLPIKSEGCHKISDEKSDGFAHTDATKTSSESYECGNVANLVFSPDYLELVAQNCSTTEL